ncbi:MAG: acyl-CoA reductase [Polyangiaceae bacterium]
MSDDVDARIARVRAVVDAARTLAPDASLVDPIARSTGLSREGVGLALRSHLETDPSDEDLRSLVSRMQVALHVHVILSSNVFTASLRAVACASAASASVSVQTSSREPHFANALLRAIANPAIFKADRDYVTSMSTGEIHVYGRGETIDAIEKLAPPGIVIRAHGPGFGVACVVPGDQLELAASNMATDVVPFDQRGCLSPRVAFVVGDSDRARAFADRLAVVLERMGSSVPRGTLDDDEKADAARYVDTMRFAGHVAVGATCTVGLSESFTIPPSGRHVHVMPLGAPTELTRVIAPVSHLVTAVGASDRTLASFFPDFVRYSKLGVMQKPPLDGPVDLRALG